MPEDQMAKAKLLRINVGQRGSPYLAESVYDVTGAVKRFCQKAGRIDEDNYKLC